mgnify:CR=1 FL=1
MYLLTYEKLDGHPVKLVFDSNEEALYWGSQYSIENNQSEYTISSYPSNEGSLIQSKIGPDLFTYITLIKQRYRNGLTP